MITQGRDLYKCHDPRLLRNFQSYMVVVAVQGTNVKLDTDVCNSYLNLIMD